MLRDFTPRLYQQTILGTAAHKNTLVVLPTGLGKTAIAFLLAAQRLHQYPQSKILLLSPTKPLCEQHVQTFQKHLALPPEKIVLFTGNVAPEKRAQLWKEAQIIISTPQGLENDVINRRVRLEEVSLLAFDEAHHALGDYAYVWLAHQYEQTSRQARILALTASPGSDMETVQQVCQNLYIERVEVRTEKDPDVRPYIQKIHFQWEEVLFPSEFQKTRSHLKDCWKSKLLEAQKYGYCSGLDLRKGEILQLQADLHQKIAQGERDFELLRSVSLLAEALKVEHGLELLESQGLAQLHSYLVKIQQEALTSKIKATQNLVLDANFKAAARLTAELVQQGIEHPKLPRLLELVEEVIHQNSAAKIIIFTQFRSSAEEVIKKLQSKNISHNIFVGQAKKNGLGLSQKQQKEIIDRFRAGEFNVLVATSVAEEGLDIPRVDKVIFYEPVPSAIRSIQRRGRTGRLEQGEVTMLITKGTRDEAYRWSAHHKEKRMYRNLEKLRTNLAFLSVEKKEATLQPFIKDQVVAIVADHREKDNKVLKELMELGISVTTAQLQTADYLISGQVAVELKKIPDFVNSIIDGRLLEQARGLKQFDKAVIIIEGEEDIYAVRQIHPNAIRGMLASLVLDFGIPVLYTKNPRETAAVLAVMAKREQDRGRDFSYHERKPRTLNEQQEFIVSSLSGIGVQTARKLLENFHSIKNIVNASKEELLLLEGVGEKTAGKLTQLFTEEYRKN